MARPRKDQVEPSAPDRIKDAFWTLIAQHNLRDITVGMIAQEACCNRGTFYYHFESIDDLLHEIVEEQLLSTDSLPRDLMVMFCDDGTPFTSMLPKRARRLCLLMRQAGNERVGSQIKRVVVGMWEAILCDGGECLSQETRLTIEYSVSGIIGAIDYLDQTGDLDEDLIAPSTERAIRQITRLLLNRISEAQGITCTELEERISMFNRILEMRQAEDARIESA